MYIESARVPSDIPYRDFHYPLNVFMHVLTHEEGRADHLHYGLFERPGESIAVAQQRSTDLLLSHLPAPPASLLEVGIGLGTTLDVLTRRGYAAVGITPDEKQIEMARRRFPDASLERVAFEAFPPRPFDVVVFQESSQYIDPGALFGKCAGMTSDVLVVDEFSTGQGTLHRLDNFLSAAKQHQFRKVEDLDLSQKAAPTVDYFMQRFDRYRERLVAELGISAEQFEELLESGKTYRANYANGNYVYRLFRFKKE